MLDRMGQILSITGIKGSMFYVEKYKVFKNFASKEVCNILNNVANNKPLPAQAYDMKKAIITKFKLKVYKTPEESLYFTIDGEGDSKPLSKNPVHYEKHNTYLFTVITKKGEGGAYELENVMSIDKVDLEQGDLLVICANRIQWGYEPVKQQRISLTTCLSIDDYAVQD
jgi:hypothetical protein